jgi:hypothetical protein
VPPSIIAPVASAITIRRFIRSLLYQDTRILVEGNA